jgi:formate hydrogenlyase subunit 3/multisubunit Na+/H+ antiporter MnhD subunit
MYMMIIPKLCILFLLQILGFFHDQSFLIFFAILSLILGSIGLISQIRLIRFFSYSGLTHLALI